MLFSNFEALKRADENYKYPKYIFWVSFRIIIVIMFAFAMAGTHLNYETTVNRADYVLALDASSSMTSTDIPPSRFEAAKDAEILFLDSLADSGVKSRVSLITFSGTTLIHLSPTYDTLFAKNTVRSLNISHVPGTAIGEAIVNSVNLLHDSDKAKIVYLVTDGASNVGVDVDFALNYAKERGTTINTIGVGTKASTVYEDRLSTSLDKDMLVRIAEETHGNYYFVKDVEELRNVFSNKQIQTHGIYDIDLTRYLLFAILLLFMSEWVFINTREKAVP